MTKSFNELSLKERCQFERDNNFSIANYRAGISHVKAADRDGYDIVFRGQRIGSTSKGWTRLGGQGWVNIFPDNFLQSQGSTYTSLDQALRGAADQLMRRDVRLAYERLIKADKLEAEGRIADAIRLRREVHREERRNRPEPSAEAAPAAAGLQQTPKAAWIETPTMCVLVGEIRESVKQPTLHEALELIKSMVISQAKSDNVPVDEWVMTRPWLKRFIYTLSAPAPAPAVEATEKHSFAVTVNGNTSFFQTLRGATCYAKTVKSNGYEAEIRVLLN